MCQFGAETRHIYFVNKFREYTSNDAKSYAEYVTEAWRLFTRISPHAPEDLKIEAVISGIRPKFYQAELLRAMPKSQAELIATLSNYRKRPAGFLNSEIENKRPRFEPPGTNSNEQPSNTIQSSCTRCGRRGHKSQDCKIPICYICKKPGHTTNNCWTRTNNHNATQPARSTTSRQPTVNSLQKTCPSCTTVQIGNVTLSCLIDTGAECSLISKKSSGSIPGKREINLLQMRGVSGEIITSNEIIKTTITINEVTFEANLHVVDCLFYDVILGIDSLLIPGIKIELCDNGIKIIRDPSINSIQKDSFPTNIDTDLTDKTKLTEILTKHTEAFVMTSPIKKVSTGTLKIRLKDPSRVVQRRPYRLAPIERENVKNIICDLKQRGIVRDSCSPYASPILLVKKKDGTDRLCVDYRELNSNIVRDQYPLPLIQDQIDKLGTAKFFTTLDMESGFHQIPIEEESIEKTAFVTPDGQFEYLTMPFGLCNSPSVYQRAINQALGDYKDKIALVYMDDVLILSDNEQEGLERLDMVLTRLSDAGFTLKLAKCSFLKKSVEYLGNIVENGQVKPSSRKIEALKNSKPPNSVKQVRQFNGLASYFRRFIPQFSQTMAPLYNLTKKDVKFQWTKEHEKIRQEIINYLTSDPILSIFDHDLPVEVHTDASSLGYGAILIQIKEGRRKVISYFSMRTTDAESKYHSYELETLAVVKALKHFRHFLYGRHFVIVTDCNALKASRTKKRLNAKGS